ncbi:hypothetical protein DFR48_101343 [Ciceribacter lividus]|uniref:Uncharacterized protein n=1 Tax=Ciceribacter lividus TaxID=1197950 RepID=A0A6I7HTN6_9HYPH|nr:hypothetical protein [Ciceribacter lividus]RCW28332.1 hypothetical protein DFR48_101343 [Ciceribacter lividus]
MTSNKPQRESPWRIGSFTKNFSWGSVDNGFKRLHHAINVGFKRDLKPVPRELFWERLERGGFVPHIPSNFFVFNGTIDRENYIFPDELVFKALSSEHDRSFDKLALFTLLLSEVGKWKGARSGQSQPSEWARYFILERLQGKDTWAPTHYSANEIEKFLSETNRFEGGSGTRKLATNLAYFFSLARLDQFAEEDNLSWITDSVFLALDRYFMIKKPENFGVEWAIDTLAENGIADLAGPFEETFLTYEAISARLYTESKGVDRLKGTTSTVIGVLSREPLLYKELPAIVGNWLKNRLFVEFVDKDRLEQLKSFNAEQFYDKAIEKLHNSLPKPTLNGNELIALVRPQDDSD